MPRHKTQIDSRHGETRRSEALRLSLAQAAARIMAEQGVNDFLTAKRKAAEQLHVRDQSALPSNAEIEAALLTHQRLFHAHSHSNEVRELRRVASELMGLLRDFEPRLVGSVLSGSATLHSEIQVHVFADQPETVSLRLLERGIATHHGERKLRYEAERVVSYPSFKFLAGDHPVEVVVLSGKDMRQAPLSPVDGRPMRRANISEVKQLL